MVFLALAAIVMTLTAILHSLAGERLLVTPLLAIKDPLIERNPDPQDYPLLLAFYKRLHALVGGSYV